MGERHGRYSWTRQNPVLREICSYCYSDRNIVSLCKDHTPCKNCLIKDSYPTDINKCKTCFDLINNYCSCCFQNKNTGTHLRNPSHLIHSYCPSCLFNRQLKLDDIPCSRCYMFYYKPPSYSLSKCIFCKSELEKTIGCAISAYH